MGPPATKENRKGSTRRYGGGRGIGTLIFLLVAASLVFVRRRTGGARGPPPPPNDKGGGTGAGTGTVARRPVRTVETGVRSTPVVMIRASMERGLLGRFLQERLFSCAEEELYRIPGLDHRVQPPVYVHEGYYHALRVGEDVYSKNPNPLIGKDFMKPAASPFTRAFFDAFRRVNGEIFDSLRRKLLAGAKEGDVCYHMAKWIERGHHFGDLSVQIHYGKGNDQKLKSGAAWHTDAENSLLHLAVTLRGSRVLHSERGPRGSAANATLRRRAGRETTEVLEPQDPGDVYLSSSTLMRHAPQFPDADYGARAIAIHARILYTSADVDGFRNKRTKDSWERLTTILANTLAAANLQIPSLAQVESTLLSIS